MIQYVQYVLIISEGILRNICKATKYLGLGYRIEVHTEIEHLNDLPILPEKTIYHGSCSIRCDRISYVNMTQYPDLICPIIGKNEIELLHIAFFLQA